MKSKREKTPCRKCSIDYDHGPEGRAVCPHCIEQALRVTPKRIARLFAILDECGQSENPPAAPGIH